jgi:cytochrome c oxidase assembly protein subunit 15
VPSSPPTRRAAAIAWGALAYTVLVILWGAYVRATGSGAGCGSHWPLCNGAVIPRGAGIQTLVEYSHRLTSGVALIGVVVVIWLTWRACAPGHPARRGAAWSVFFMLTEAAVGAALVLFQLVADNASMARAMFMAAHLVNTFLLIGAMTLTAHWLSGGAPVTFRRHPAVAAAVLGLALLLLLVGVSGAVAALGDTLFPSASLADALAADLSPTSHVLIRLRAVHPVLAVIGAGVLIVAALRMPRPVADRRAAWASRAVAGLAFAQVLAGLVNVLLLAPVWMQMLHLLLADALWIAFVILAASALAVRPGVRGA